MVYLVEVEKLCLGRNMGLARAPGRGCLVGGFEKGCLSWVALKAEPETGLGAGGVFSWGSLEAEMREQEK